MTGLLCAFVLAVSPAEPRLQWESAGGMRAINRYGGKWAITRNGKTMLAVETERTADAIVLKPETGEPIRLTGGKWVTKFPVIELGHLSEKYESSGRGPATVSTGEGDPGGVSYGSYQLASKIGRADEFVKRSLRRSLFLDNSTTVCGSLVRQKNLGQGEVA